MRPEQQLSFDPFRLDRGNACVWRGTQALALRPKAFAVLQYLVEHAGRLVTKEELLNAVWPQTAVSDAVLKVCISEIRKVLDDPPKMPQFIATVHRRGYRFIAKIRDADPLPAVRQEGQALQLVLGPSPRSPQPISPRPVRLVGREGALAQLHRWLERALRGERQLVFVTGEPGIGKTALVEAFAAEAAADPSLWIACGQCVEHYWAGEAYLPVLEALGQLCRTPGGERLMALLRQQAPTWLVQLPWLLSTADWVALQREILGATQERMLRELTGAVEALTAETPLVLVLEDLHWSDYATLDLLAALARRREPARLLLIGTYRPVEVIISGHPLKAVKVELQAHGQCQELPLEGLSEAAVAEYLSARCPGSEGTDELASVLQQRTEGHPLLMVALVEEWVARGVLGERDGQWELTVGLEAVDVGVPEHIRQMLEQQLDRLSPEEQRVLGAASVAGVEFSAAAVAAALQEEVVAVEERCASNFCTRRGRSNGRTGR